MVGPADRGAFLLSPRPPRSHLLFLLMSRPRALFRSVRNRKLPLTRLSLLGSFLLLFPGFYSFLPFAGARSGIDRGQLPLARGDRIQVSAYVLSKRHLALTWRVVVAQICRCSTRALPRHPTHRSCSALRATLCTRCSPFNLFSHSALIHGPWICRTHQSVAVSAANTEEDGLVAGPDDALHSYCQVSSHLLHNCVRQGGREGYKQIGRDRQTARKARRQDDRGGGRRGA